MAFRPHIFYKYRTLFVSTSRIAITAQPTTPYLLGPLLGGTGPLGKRWGASRIGVFGIILFSSRTLSYFLSSLGTPLTVGQTILVQILLAGATYTNEWQVCSSKLASTPEVVSWLNGFHIFFDHISTLIFPFSQLIPLPSRVIDPGTSLSAVSWTVRLISFVAPIIGSAFRSSTEYKAYLIAWQNDDDDEDEVRGGGVEVEELYSFPMYRVHAVWASGAVLCGVWTVSYCIAAHLCGTQLGFVVE